MLSMAYKKTLAAVSLALALSILALPASASCFYNKINPHDFSPKGDQISSSNMQVLFLVKLDKGHHLWYRHWVSLGEHICVGGKGVNSAVHAPGDNFYALFNNLHAGPHGYIVATSESLGISSKYAKYVKFTVSSYSNSNALTKSVSKDLKCTVVHYSPDIDGSSLKCVIM